MSPQMSEIADKHKNSVLTPSQQNLATVLGAALAGLWASRSCPNLSGADRWVADAAPHSNLPDLRIINHD